MVDQLDDIEQQVASGRNFDAPPLHLWHPALSGDIDIRIATDGTWYHEGAPILREAIVRLFAAILRREEDGEYYLLTPGEKWRIQVDLHPLVVTDVELVEEEGNIYVELTLNTGKVFRVDEQHQLFLESAVGNIAAVTLPHGLSALFSRPAWYRLVEMSEPSGAGLAIAGLQLG